MPPYPREKGWGYTLSLSDSLTSLKKRQTLPSVYSAFALHPFLSFAFAVSPSHKKWGHFDSLFQPFLKG